MRKEKIGFSKGPDGSVVMHTETEKIFPSLEEIVLLKEKEANVAERSKILYFYACVGAIGGIAAVAVATIVTKHVDPAIAIGAGATFAWLLRKSHIRSSKADESSTTAVDQLMGARDAIMTENILKAGIGSEKPWLN